MKLYPVFILVVAWILLCPSTIADDSRVTYEAEISAGISDVWKAFTTNQGLQSWMAPIAEIELAIGGKMKANYNPQGKIGDPTTIENTILSYDPERMLSLKATKFPADFPFLEAAKKTWSVFYFSELSPTRTKITVVGLGYTDDETSRKMREFFTSGNKHSLDQLNEALSKRQEAQDD